MILAMGFMRAEDGQEQDAKVASNNQGRFFRERSKVRTKPAAGGELNDADQQRITDG